MGYASCAAGRVLRPVQASGSAQDCLVSVVALLLDCLVVEQGLDAHSVSDLESSANLRMIDRMRRVMCH